jgi:hypothetical protein
MLNTPFLIYHFHFFCWDFALAGIMLLLDKAFVPAKPFARSKLLFPQKNLK